MKHPTFGLFPHAQGMLKHRTGIIRNGNMMSFIRHGNGHRISTRIYLLKSPGLLLTGPPLKGAILSNKILKKTFQQINPPIQKETQHLKKSKQKIHKQNKKTKT
jgi:hypothetical protein